MNPNVVFQEFLTQASCSQSAHIGETSEGDAILAALTFALC
jgi:hypothetical protein